MFEAAPELPYIVIALVEFASYLFARAALFLWALTFGLIFGYLGTHLRYRKRVFGVHIVIDFGFPFRFIDRTMRRELDAWAIGANMTVGWSLHGMARLADWTVAETESLAQEIVRQEKWAWGFGIPTAIKHRVEPVQRAADAASAQADAAAKAVAGIAHSRTIDTHTGARIKVAIPHALAVRLAADEAELRRVSARVDTMTGAIAHPLPRIHTGGQAITWPYGLTPTGIRRRLRKLEKVTVGTGLLVAFASAVGLGSWRCLRSGNVGRMMRHLCGLDKVLLDLLLGGAFFAFAVTDICDYATALERLAEWFRPLLMDFVDVDEWLVRHCHYSRPDPLTLPPLTLPAQPLGLALSMGGDPLGSNVRLAAATNALASA